MHMHCLPFTYICTYIIILPSQSSVGTVAIYAFNPYWVVSPYAHMDICHAQCMISTSATYIRVNINGSLALSIKPSL